MKIDSTRHFAQTREDVLSLVYAGSRLSTSAPRRVFVQGDQWSGRRELLRQIAEEASTYGRQNDLLVLSPLIEAGVAPDLHLSEVGDALLFLSTLAVTYADDVAKILAGVGAGLVVAGDLNRRRRARTAPSLDVSPEAFLSTVATLSTDRDALVCVIDVESALSSDLVERTLRRLITFERQSSIPIVLVLGGSTQAALALQRVFLGDSWVRVEVPTLGAEQVSEDLGVDPQLAADIVQITGGRLGLVNWIFESMFRPWVESSRTVPLSSFACAWAQGYVMDSLVEALAEDDTLFGGGTEARLAECAESIQLISLCGPHNAMQMLHLVGRHDDENDLSRLITSMTDSQRYRLFIRDATGGYVLQPLLGELLRESALRRIATIDKTDTFVYAARRCLEAQFSLSNGALWSVPQSIATTACAVGRPDLAARLKSAYVDRVDRERRSASRVLAREIRGHGLMRWDPVHLLAASISIKDVLISGLFHLDAPTSFSRADTRDLHTARRALQLVRASGRPEADVPLGHILLALARSSTTFSASGELVEIAVRTTGETRRGLLLSMGLDLMTISNWDISLHFWLHCLAEMAFEPHRDPPSVAPILIRLHGFLHNQVTTVHSAPDSIHSYDQEAIRLAMELAIYDPDRSRGAEVVANYMISNLRTNGVEYFNGGFSGIAYTALMNAVHNDSARIACLISLLRLSDFDSTKESVAMMGSFLADLMVRAERSAPADEPYYWCYGAWIAEQSGMDRKLSDVLRIMGAHVWRQVPTGKIANGLRDILPEAEMPQRQLRHFYGSVTVGKNEIDHNSKDLVFETFFGADRGAFSTKLESASLATFKSEKASGDGRLLAASLSLRSYIGELGAEVGCRPFDLAERDRLLEELASPISSAWMG